MASQRTMLQWLRKNPSLSLPERFSLLSTDISEIGPGNLHKSKFNIWLSLLHFPYHQQIQKVFSKDQVYRHLRWEYPRLKLRHLLGHSLPDRKNSKERFQSLHFISLWATITGRQQITYSITCGSGALRTTCKEIGRSYFWNVLNPHRYWLTISSHFWSK